MKHLIPIALCALLIVPSHATEPEPEFKPAAGYVAGGAVICFGGYCVYKLWKTCQRLFPKTTNSEPSNSGFIASSDAHEYGAAFNYTPIGSCEEHNHDNFNASSNEEDRFIASLKIVVDENGSVMSSIRAGRALPEQRQSWTEFQADVASHGLVVNSSGDGSKYYSKNRIPCSPEEVPITFDDQTQTIVHSGFAGQMRNIIIERSRDFQSWSRFMSTTVPYGTGLQVDDLTKQGQMFYRVISQ